MELGGPEAGGPEGLHLEGQDLVGELPWEGEVERCAGVGGRADLGQVRPSARWCSVGGAAQQRMIHFSALVSPMSLRPCARPFALH